MWPIRETRLSLEVKGFCWGLVTESHSACATAITDAPDHPEGKQAPNISHGLHKLSRQARVVPGFKWARPSYLNIQEHNFQETPKDQLGQ